MHKFSELLGIIELTIPAKVLNSVIIAAFGSVTFWKNTAVAALTASMEVGR